MLGIRIAGALTLAAVIFASLSPGPARGQEDRRAQVMELMTVTGARGIGMQMGSAIGEQFFAAMRAANPNVPRDVHDTVQQVVMTVVNERLDDLFDRLVPLYERHFTGAELSELIRFYRTPVGAKTINVMPVLMQEALSVNQAWAQSLQPEIERRIRERLERPSR